MKSHGIAFGICAGFLALNGCGGQETIVTGKVTCQDKPVTGSILFSPKGEDDSNPAGGHANVALNEDGTYQLRLKTTGKHIVVVTPSDVKLRVKPGQFDYPCDRSPVEREIQAGENDITIELPTRRK